MSTQLHYTVVDPTTPDVNSSHIFNVHPLTSVSLDTYVKLHALSLTQGDSYRVTVIAVDEAGGCMKTSGVFTVDTTPPEDGRIGVGPDTNSVC